MDQCMNCTVRGDIDACMKTPCSQHESWYAQTLKAQQRKPLEEPLVGALLYLFQEWKEDHLSQSNYIDCVEGIKAAHGITSVSDFKG